ncbi:Serine/threonine-protein kinase ATG1 [Neolecta irregularis DAH-3]|uniref:non-specific serine/threonine protein kinase n=1 Tax=Neolecta irregularis (strain DAH-3) TaxID=1198029 RepID=A0A1U7LU85_NEOID|nr:Serine/threonine-protein kinase ATG1 [Neolecta irregularis DAH-3]|eukprot:OLL26178.1 Serine/threonine-protein kinase ATG1 [Neolecta irregularis DAH-3]
MDFCALGDLSHMIRQRAHFARIPGFENIPKYYPNTPTAGLHEHVTCHFTQHLCSAMEYLRSQNLIHRDLKPQNLLLTNPNPEASYIGSRDLPVLKVADFGFARMLPSKDMASTLCGSPLYMAPEILRYEKYDARVDLWSIGGVIYEMVMGKPPFRAENHIDLLRKIDINQDKLVFSPNISQEPVCSDSLQSLVRGLLRRIPDDRISFAELFSHPVVTEALVPQTPAKEELSQMMGDRYVTDYTLDDIGTLSPSPTIKRTATEPPLGTSNIRTREEGSLDDAELEREYVVVEKKTVEVNELADEIAANPQNQLVLQTRKVERAATAPFVSTSPRSGSMLARAISMASTRLHGSPPWRHLHAASPRNQMILYDENVDREEEKLLSTINGYIMRIHVIYRFAEIKYMQLVGSEPPILTTGATSHLSSEALVLYVKTLSLLQKTMDIAGNHWKQANICGKTFSTARLNNYVQWARSRFNECLEKAEFVRSKVTEEQVEITAERLIYDRVLDIARTAAVNELTGDDLLGSKASYETAIAMLEALQERESSEEMCEEDRQTIETCMLVLAAG